MYFFLLFSSFFFFLLHCDQYLHTPPPSNCRSTTSQLQSPTALSAFRCASPAICGQCSTWCSRLCARVALLVVGMKAAWHKLHLPLTKQILLHVLILLQKPQRWLNTISSNPSAKSSLTFN